MGTEMPWSCVVRGAAARPHIICPAVCLLLDGVTCVARKTQEYVSWKALQSSGPYTVIAARMREAAIGCNTAAAHLFGNKDIMTAGAA